MDLHELLADGRLPSLEGQEKWREFREEVSMRLATLPHRDEGVIRIRFGIGLERESKPEEVGRRLGISRQRARQIEARALQLLRRAIPRKMEVQRA